MTRRNVYFLLFNIIALVVFYAPMKDLIALSFNKAVYSHIILIPLVSGYFMYSERKIIFSSMQYSFTYGTILIIAGIILYLIGMTQGIRLNQNDYLSLITLSALVFWIGGFIVSYGPHAFRAASFPLLFLIFMIPIPALAIEKLILLLQKGSAEAAYGFFMLTGIPFVREGYIFHLSTVSVEVAEQCSGIRSGIALFITGILAGHIFLQTGWKKIILVLSIFPVAIIKNGLRIVTLSLLGAYVDKAFLTDSLLHKKGGILFFILAIMLLAPVLWMLRKSERGGNPESLSKK